LSNTSGQKLPAPKIAQADAETVGRVRKAGGIPFVVTNTPELCMCYETDNKNTGRTCNPYDLRRTPGGSSGGEVSNSKQAHLRSGRGRWRLNAFIAARSTGKKLSLFYC
jgi:hypothetical protein